MKRSLILLCITFFTFAVFAQVTEPVITSWIRNTNGATGYNNLPSNVQVVQYTTTDVYVSSSCIPSYSIGPWSNNPNTPSNQNFVTKFTRTPAQNTGTAVYPPLGNIGMWSNGVAIFNPKDGQYWNNTTSAFTMGSTNNGWNRNALYFEGVSFDNCLGHPAPGGVYHNHVNPKCLYNAADSTHHSPIIGYAFDGFPVYGAYGYTNTNGTGAIKRMKSSFVLSTATTRNAGPPVNTSYPLGSMCEDYVYTAGAGDLDIHNGRFCVTPEYPSGTYAYFVTIDASLNPVYPFVIGTTYYGTVQAGNTGPTGSHNSIPGNTTVYNGNASGLQEILEIKYSVSPNPATDAVYIQLANESMNNITGSLYNSKGQQMQAIDDMHPGFLYTIDISTYPKGVYFLRMQGGNLMMTEKIIKVR